ncbi:MAG: vWA domain-containing protein [Myxococcota bacterium]
MRAGRILACLAALTMASACQDYVFELREPSRVDARQIREVVAQLTPADILFIVDNSNSMGEEIQELQNNLDRFITELSASDNEFQVGIITTDVECNVPTNDCLLPNGSVNPDATTSTGCCFQRSLNPDTNPCTETDQDGDGAIDTSTCDGGRLRSATASGRRVFTRPEESERAAWADEVSSAIEQARNNLRGSTYEAGLLAATTAVACSLGDPSCPDPAVSQLNQGFIREEADLVLIFLTDEDDCSVANLETYTRPPDLTSSAERATRFCAAIDCYAYYANQDLVPVGGDGLNDFVNSGITCEPGPGDPLVSRTENPPGLRAVEGFLDDLVALKGDVSRIRAAGIISATATLGADLGFSAQGCFNRITGPSEECGCLSGSGNELNCLVTERNGQSGMRMGVATNGVFGCEALPSGRYAEFLQRLSTRRIEASRASDVLIDSICNSSYNETLSDIVNNVILSNCFALGQIPMLVTDDEGMPTESISDRLRVTINGALLPNVAPEAEDAGWSWREGSDEVCLEGGLSKSINDEVEILVLQ